MRHRIALLISALVAGFSFAGVLAASSAEASSITLPITSYYQMVTDTSKGLLFISQGSSSKNSILVTDFSGQEVTTITGQDGVMGLALSADGSTLYAALSSDHAVTAIDTSTLKQTASYPLGDANTPRDVAVQSGKIWVSYDTGTAGTAAIGDIDLTADTPAFETQAAMGGWYSAPDLGADPQDSGVLVALGPGLDPAPVASYNVNADPATVNAQSAALQNCENSQDLAVVPGGAQFILACGAPYAHYRYSTADLSQQGSYASTNYPAAVAIDANGDVAAGTANNPYKPDLYVYAAGGDTPLNTFSLVPNGSSNTLTARGLAWAADGSALFAVIDNADGTFTLQVLDAPTLTGSALSLTGPTSVGLGGRVTLTGSLKLGGSAAPAGTSLTVSRTIAGGGAAKNFKVTTTAGGAFSVRDTPTAIGKYMYTAKFAGTKTTAPATASRSVTITLPVPSLTLATGSASRTYEPTIHLTAHLGATASNRTVSIYATPFGSSARTQLKTARVNAGGNLTVAYKAAHSTKFTVAFAGDTKDGPVTVSKSVTVKAKVSQSLKGYYGSTHIHGTLYRLFHHTHVLEDLARIAPNKSGQCVQFEVQEFFDGAWRPNVTSACATLTSSSLAGVQFNISHADIDFRYRIRSDYVRSSSDTSNLSNDSGWLYLEIKT